MADVASLADWRSAGPDDTGPRRCACGSEWFELRRHDGAAPIVTMNDDGSITGYAATEIACRNCGRIQ